MKADLVPGFVFSCIGSVLFVAGILNVLQEATWIIWAGGVYCFIKSVRDRRSLKMIMTPGILLFAAFSVFFLLLLYQSKFDHYDDFSHWGVAAKVVCPKNGFPNLVNKNIAFQSYPLGSTCFIYYFAEIIGIHPEWLQMLAQAILMAGMAVSVFAFCRNKTQMLLAGISVLFLMCSNTRFVNLLVDTLLPLTAFAAFAFCVYYKDEISQKVYYIIPYAVFLVSIKNSGILFASFTLLFVLMHINNKSENIKKYIKVAISPVIVLYFWKKHVEQVFIAGVAAKHSMTLENYYQVISQKTGEDVRTIFETFLRQMVNDSKLFFLLMGCCCAVWIFSRCSSKKREKDVGNLVLFVCLSYFVYQLGMLGMYLFSMPGAEAINLAGYSRYHKTILIYDMAILVLAAIMTMDSKQITMYKISNSVFAVAILLFSWNILSPNLYNYQRQTSVNPDRIKFDCLIDDYRIESGYNYMVVVSEDRDDAGFLYYLAQYSLSPEKLDICKDTDLQKYDWKRYDYIIVFEETDIAQAFLLEEYETTKPVICQIDW